MDITGRYRGCLLGLAVGDAVGTALEFSRPGSFRPITDMVGGGPFRLKPGQWTDDTSMALCLAESLVEKKEFDPSDQMQRYVRWWKEGHLSCTGECFDIGNATCKALRNFVYTGEALSGSTDPNSAGNGSIMRLAPVPMFYAEDPLRAIEYAAESSKTTHGAATAVDACRYFAAIQVGALIGETKEALLADHYSPVEGYWEDHPLVPEIREIASGSFRQKEPPEIQGSGYVVRSLEAALWAFNKSGNFREGCLMASNLGDDADTTAAVYGQLAGAFYGEAGIPRNWLDCLAMREMITLFADQLLALSRGEGTHPVAAPGSDLAAEVFRAALKGVDPVPSDRAYWVVPGKFLAGAYPGNPYEKRAVEKLRVFLDAGIRCFIDLTSPEDENLYGKALVPYRDLIGKISDGRFKVHYRRMPIVDMEIPSHDEMLEILDLIDGTVFGGIPTYVHCLGGFGRTGTVVGCWLVRHGIEQGKAVIELIRKLRRNDPQVNMESPQTADQRRFILEWKQGE